MKKIAVMLPCYNEVKTIAKVVADFRRILPEAEIYLFDNNSTDGSADAVKDEVVIIPVRQQGKGFVVRRMFQIVEADVFVLVDSDDSYPADAVTQMIDLVEAGADMVCGDRLSSTYFTVNKRPGHNFGNRLVRKLLNLIWHAEIKDVLSGYRVFSRRFVKSCPILSNGFEIETEITVHALDKRMCIVEIPIEYRDRPEGSVSKLNTVWDGIKILKMLFNMFRHYRPLLFFGLISAFMLLLGITLAAPVFAEYFHTGMVPRFPTLIFSCFLLSSSIFFFGIGLILDAIKKRADEAFELKLLTIASNEKL